MCEICHMSNCPSGCPNAPEPMEIYTCKYCGGPIVAGDEYVELDGDNYHFDECFENAAASILIEQYGARVGVAEEKDND